MADYDKYFVLFRKIDKSGDGKVSKEEIVEACRKDETLTGYQGRELLKFSEVDEDGSKVVAFPAFYRAITGVKLDQRVSPSILATFSKLDSDADGYITQTDIQRAIASGTKMGKKAQEKLFKTDANGDGKISLSEYVAAYTAEIQLHLNEEEEKKIRATFDRLDANGDGWVSKAELKRAAELLGLQDSKFIKTLSKADMDGDGAISFEEFVALMIA